MKNYNFSALNIITNKEGVVLGDPLFCYENHKDTFMDAVYESVVREDTDSVLDVLINHGFKEKGYLDEIVLDLLQTAFSNKKLNYTNKVHEKLRDITKSNNLSLDSYLIYLDYTIAEYGAYLKPETIVEIYNQGLYYNQSIELILSNGNIDLETFKLLNLNANKMIDEIKNYMVSSDLVRFKIPNTDSNKIIIEYYLVRLFINELMKE